MPISSFWLQALSSLSSGLRDARVHGMIAWRHRKMEKVLRRLPFGEDIIVAALLPSDPAVLQSYRTAFVEAAGASAVALKEHALKVLADEGALRGLTRIENPFDVHKDVAALVLIEALFTLAHGNASVKAKLVARREELILIAIHFGYWKLRYRLEDALFRAADPAQYAIIADLLKKQFAHHARLFADVEAIVRHGLEVAGLREYTIVSRKKNVYGVYKKIHAKERNINQITDFYGVRILTQTPEDCYRAVEVLHGLWPAFPGRLKDYIAHPKDNTYQSIHTTVLCLDKHPVEFQIRTFDMHHMAKHGPASHKTYKAIHALTPLRPVLLRRDP